MKKLLAIILSLLTVFSLSAITAMATEEDASKLTEDIYTETVTVDYSKFNSFSPEKEIDVNGKKYIFSGYKVISNEKETFEIVTENLTNKEYTAPENIVNPNNSEQSGKLITTTFSENKESNRSKLVSDKISFERVRLDYQVPSTRETQYTDDKTNSVINADLKLSGTEKSSPYWINTNSLKGTVTGYDSPYYSLENSNIEIPKNDNHPNYKGYENAILKSLNLNVSNYKITGSSWSGDAYYNSEGILCRNCIYNAQLRVCDITATYSSDIKLPDISTYTATSIYEDENGSQYTIEIEYEKSAISPKIIAAVSVGAGLLIISALIAIILVYLSKKKEKGNDEQINSLIRK